MKSLLVLFSYNHKNTEKVAKVFAEIFDAEIKTPQQTDPDELEDYDLVGFGAGIDSGKHYKVLIDFADKPSQVDNKNVFIFSTAGLTGEKNSKKTTQSLGKNWNRKVIG